jgi:hypothetical protein
MVEGESILLGTEPDANGVPWALLAVSTFKVANWGPIALRGVPRGRGLAAHAFDAEPIMRWRSPPKPSC